MAHYEENIASPHSRSNDTISDDTDPVLEDAMKLLEEAVSRLESSDTRKAGDNKLGEMIIQTSTDNLTINLTVGDTLAKDKSKHVSAILLFVCKINIVPFIITFQI